LVTQDEGYMIDVTVAFLCAYLIRTAHGLVDRAVSDADAAFTAKLGELYDWVRGRLAGSRSAEASLRMLENRPDGADEQVVLAEQLEYLLANDKQATPYLAQLVRELENLRPVGVDLAGWAHARHVAGSQIGVRVDGTLRAGDHVQGAASADEVSGEQYGVVYNPEP
jgi:hypothetical protein